MPTIHTLGTKAIMAARYKAGKENRRRYDQEFAEDVKNKKAERAIAAFNANSEARKNFYEAEKNKAESKAISKYLLYKSRNSKSSPYGSNSMPSNTGYDTSAWR